MATVRYTRAEIEKMSSRTNWEKLKNKTDEEIDFSDIPEWTDEMFADATRGGIPLELPQRVTIYLRPSLLANYRRTGRGWRTRLSNNFEAWLNQNQNVLL